MTVVLALNSGSASLKAAAYRLPSVPAEGNEALLLGRASTEREPGSDDASADAELEAVVAKLGSRDPVDCVVHRIVHGGRRAHPVELSTEVVAELGALIPWAPLHQPVALALVGAARRHWPQSRQVGVFDTSWHLSMPDKHRVLALPQRLLGSGVERYGFHGLAFQSVLRQLQQIAPDVAHRRVVMAHLGGGSSVCAALDGRSINTTMGLTPLDGLPMATRSGSLDPGVLLHLVRSGLTTGEIERVLWRESGLLGISGESSDMRVLLASEKPESRLAVDVYISAVTQCIASMATTVGGIDALVFSGGIGANSPEVRRRIAAGLSWTGMAINPERRQGELSAPGILARSFAVDVDEEYELVQAFPGG